MSPERSHYYVVPRANSRAVLAFHSREYNRFYPVRAIGEPLASWAAPFPRLSSIPLPHLP